MPPNVKRQIGGPPGIANSRCVHFDLGAAPSSDVRSGAAERTRCAAASAALRQHLPLDAFSRDALLPIGHQGVWLKASDDRGEFGLTVCVKGILNPKLRLALARWRGSHGVDISAHMENDQVATHNTAVL
jgi:hypothetical protein